MQRTTGGRSDGGGRARSMHWEAFEIGFAAHVIAAGASFESQPIHGEGFRDFHVYVGRTVTTAACLVKVNVYHALIQLAPLVRAGGPVVIGTWLALLGQSRGVFYFGEKVLLTDAQGRNFRFSPVFSVEIENTAAVPNTFDVWVHMQD